MTNHKSRFWRDIDKHPLPDDNCQIDVKLECGSILIECSLYHKVIYFRTHKILAAYITQWRDAK